MLTAWFLPLLFLLVSSLLLPTLFQIPLKGVKTPQPVCAPAPFAPVGAEEPAAEGVPPPALPAGPGALLGRQQAVDKLQLESSVGKLKEIISISFPHTGDGA